MSEKIEQLANQCWLKQFHLNEDGAHDYYEFDYQKFAELIIFECATVIGEKNNSTASEIGNAVLEHFGV